MVYLSHFIKPAIDLHLEKKVQGWVWQLPKKLLCIMEEIFLWKVKSMKGLLFILQCHSENSYNSGDLFAIKLNGI